LIIPRSLTIIDRCSCFHLILLLEIEEGQILGNGGFCTVIELLKVHLSNEDESKSRRENPSTDISSSMLTTIQDRVFVSQHCLRDGQCRYAIKQISENLITKSKSRFVAGVVDLAMEARYLSIIQHPHIIKLRGVSASHPCSDTFFLILDRLYDTLTDRMKHWKELGKKKGGFKSTIMDKKGNSNREEELLGTRLVAAYEICSALVFLHEKK
jgi:hypothetical protein